jgi:hypothetical protein
MTTENDDEKIIRFPIERAKPSWAFLLKTKISRPPVSSGSDDEKSAITGGRTDPNAIIVPVKTRDKLGRRIDAALADMTAEREKWLDGRALRETDGIPSIATRRTSEPYAVPTSEGFFAAMAEVARLVQLDAQLLAVLDAQSR